MKKKKKKNRFTLTYYVENKKEAEIEYINERNRYKAELEALKLLAKVKKLDYKKKDIITLTNNSRGTVYHGYWSHLSPLIDKKDKFYLRSFETQKQNKLDKDSYRKNIKTMDFLLICLCIFMVGVIFSLIVGFLSSELSKSKFMQVFDPSVQIGFLFFLIITLMLKDFIYENYMIYHKNPLIINIKITLFEVAIGFGTFTTLYSYIYKEYEEHFTQKIVTIIYFTLLIIFTIIVTRISQKYSMEIKKRDKFHNKELEN